MTTPSSLGTALITGASSGIGEVYADRLARRGYDLLLVARNSERLAALAARLSAETGRQVETLSADLAEAASLPQLERRLRDDAAITLLVNNAGLAVNGPLAEAPPDAVDAMLGVNVVALTRLAAAAAAGFTDRGKGAIVNIASVMALIDTARSAAYGASKGYVLNLTLSLDLELSPQGIQVQAVLPGLTRTPMINGGAGLPDEMVMSVDDLVDAALVGFDRRELVTIPSLEAVSDYEALAAQRAALRPFLSLAAPRRATARFRVPPERQKSGWHLATAQQSRCAGRHDLAEAAHIPLGRGGVFREIERRPRHGASPGVLKL